MKKIATLLLLLLLLLSLAGCKNKQTIYRETEDKAFKDVWEQVVDSIFVDKRTYIVEPYEKYVIESGNKDNVDTTGFGKRIARWEKEKDSLLKKSDRYIIAVRDSLTDVDRDYFNNDLQQDSLVVLVFQPTLNPLLTNKISSQKYRFVRLSKYPDINRKNGHHQAFKQTDGSLFLSHIVFNKDYTKGAFETGFAFAPEYGQYFRVFIVRKKGKWVVAAIKENRIY